MKTLIALTACFLLFCTPRHHHVAHRHESGCDKIRLAFTQKTGSRDDFVKTFPANRQHRVLECIGDAE